MLRFDTNFGAARTNIARLIEDLNSTTPLLATAQKQGRQMRFGSAQLVQLGMSLINNDPNAFDERLAYAPWVLRALAEFAPYSLLAGRVTLNVILMAIALADGTDPSVQEILAERDNDEQFLGWLVTELIPRHRLWIYLDNSFVQQMTTSMGTGERSLSPLQLCLLSRIPEVAQLASAGSEKFHSGFEDWLAGEGITQYGLFWAMKGRRLKMSQRREQGAKANEIFQYRYPEAQLDETLPIAGPISFGKGFSCERLVLMDQPILSYTSREEWPKKISMLSGHLEFILKDVIEPPAMLIFSFTARRRKLTHLNARVAIGGRNRPVLMGGEFCGNCQVFISDIVGNARVTVEISEVYMEGDLEIGAEILIGPIDLWRLIK